MSEWGIEQPSTFGNCGGCFVEGLSLVGGVALCVAMVCILPSEKNEQKQNNQPHVESVKQKTNTVPRDTIMFTQFAHRAGQHTK